MSDNEEEREGEEEGEEEEAEAEEAPSQSEAVEESVQEEVEEAPKEEEKPKAKPPPRQIEETGGATKTEAELAMLAQKRKHEEEEEAKLAHYEEQRRIQREKEEEELRLLKEKQERRKREREEEDRIMAERKQAEEERRRQEDEARKEKAEADRQKKEEEKRKRQQLMAGLQASGGPNFEIMKKDKQAEKFDKFGNIVKAKAEMGLTKEQQDEQKKRALADLVKQIGDTTGLDVAGLRTKIKDLHARITRLEGQKYDMEKRRDRQEYDLKELNERQRQISRNKAMKKGLNPDEVANSPHPPKVPVASKYDRQIDRRSYHDRYTLFEAPPKAKKPAIHHGSARPPSEWGRKESEELENLRKNLEPPKYQEAVKIEGARAPMEPIPVSIEGNENPDEEEE